MNLESRIKKLEANIQGHEEKTDLSNLSVEELNILLEALDNDTYDKEEFKPIWDKVK